MKILQKNSAQKIQKKEVEDFGISHSTGYRYLFWLFIVVVLVSIFSMVTTIYCSTGRFELFIDSVNNLNTVYFDYGRFELKESAYPVIDKIAEEMKNDDNSVIITGFTDDKGSEKFNNELSLKRANSVRNYLISKGINGNRLTVKAMGENEPVNDNSTDVNRALNRRVEFAISHNGKNIGRNAIDKFPHSRFYAEGTLNDQNVNANIVVKSRDEITADISIRDSSGTPVDSVKAEDISAILKWDTDGKFDSTEGKPRLIPINDKKKIAFTLTMDYSGSMFGVDDYNMNTPKSDKIKAMESSVELFIEQLKNNMYCKIIKFGDKVLPPLRFTRSKDVLLNSLENNCYPMGGTALYSSIYTALSDTTFQSNPTIMKTVIAFTDGMENASVRITLDSIYKKSVLTNTKVFTVGLYNDVGEYKPNENELARRKVDMVNIARNTGGFFYQADDESKLKSIYANIFNQILKSYNISIVWNSANLPPKGTQVKAELRINVKGNVRVIYKNYVME